PVTESMPLDPGQAGHRNGARQLGTPAHPTPPCGIKILLSNRLREVVPLQRGASQCKQMAICYQRMEPRIIFLLNPVQGAGVMKRRSRAIGLGSTAISFGANPASAFGSIGISTCRALACE